MKRKLLDVISGHKQWTAGVATSLMMLVPLTVDAQTNYWTNSSSGNWQDASSWSLGILPNSSQSVAIGNPGVKTVTIDATTALIYPAALTVNDLNVTNNNTLLLSAAGTNVPLRVLTDLQISEGGSVINIGSALLAGNTVRVFNNGQLSQDGGLVTNASVLMYAGANLFLTNGVFRSSALDMIYSAYVYQYGGASTIARSTIYDGQYTLYGGALSETELILNAAQGYSVFYQEGGTHELSSLQVFASNPVGSKPNYFLNGGTLRAGNVTIGPGSLLDQNGAVQTVTNTLSLQGSGRFLERVPAYYSLSGGVFSARSLELLGSIFAQTNATTTIAGSLQLKGSADGFISSVTLDSGTLACSNVTYAAEGADISQVGGTFIVTNLFSFGGTLSGLQPHLPTYTFTGGTLIASNIQLDTAWIIGSSAQSGRITNRGYFKMAGTLQVGDANEVLGRFNLSSNATINLGDGAAKLKFAKSSTEVWNSAAFLWVTNWAGLLTGGGDDQLSFGNNPSGISHAQLGQIRFVNPAGLPPGTYLAATVGAGEVVPFVPTLSYSVQGQSLVLAWTGTLILETSTNVVGPFETLASTSPVTNGLGIDPQRFFRLRSP